MMDLRADRRSTGVLAAVFAACFLAVFGVFPAAAGFVRDEVRRQSNIHTGEEASEFPRERDRERGSVLQTGETAVPPAVPGSLGDGSSEYDTAEDRKLRKETDVSCDDWTGGMVTAVVRTKGKTVPQGESGIPAAGNVRAAGSSVLPGAISEEERPQDWKVRVNQTTCTVTVYRKGIPVRAFACSVGVDGRTPDGIFSIRDKLRWWELMGPAWGQWCSHITGGILFHSIPYSGPADKYSMSSRGYNMLGQAASHGCIRLAAMNAKYLYDNVPVGSEVVIFHGTADDDPLGKPMTPYVGCWEHSYDPTDPTI